MGKEAWKKGKPKYNSTLAQILAIGGFKMTVMVHDSKLRQEVRDLLGPGVMGLPRYSEADKIRFHFSVNVTPCVRKCQTGPELCKGTVGQLEELGMRRSVVISHIYSIYDPLGLMTPITIKHKLLLQKLSTASGDWDNELDKDLAA